MNEKVSAIIPTYYPDAEFEPLLQNLLNCELLEGVLIIDSTPNNSNVNEWRKLGAKVESISKADFSHGKTRETYRKHLNTRYVLFITQDVVIKKKNCIKTLIEKIVSNQSAAAYARQLPKDNADFFAKFDRGFNYPAISREQKIGAEAIAGQLFFCSNSFALWDNNALDSISGFPPVNHNEDMLAAANLIQSGHTISYTAEAEVEHSHNLPITETFKRFRLIGKELSKNAELFAEIKGNSNLGAMYAKKLLLQTLKEKPWLLPKAFMLIATKAIGYYSAKFL